MSDRIEAEILDVFGEEVAAEVGTPFVVIEGSKGDPGKDGHSPVVTATKSGKTTTISVDGAAIATVEDGADGAQGKDGADGSNGKDGVSPTVSTAATTGGTKVTITDAKGSHEFVVKDGAKGADGSNGKDGTNGKDGADGKPGAAGADGITPHIGGNGNWYLGDTDTGVSAGGGTADAVLYTAQTLTDPQQLQARKNIGALPSEEPIIKGGAFTLDTPGAQIRAQLDGYLTSETGEDFANIGFASTHPDATNDHIVISGLANFGDAEMVGLEDTAVSYAQLMDYTKPLMLTYDNNQVTGASYYEIRKAIERGRQIKLAVANTTDIIAANAKNETDKSVLEFIDTEVGGDTVFIQQYNVTAQASGLTVAVKSIELP